MTTPRGARRCSAWPARCARRSPTAPCPPRAAPSASPGCPRSPARQPGRSALPLELGSDHQVFEAFGVPMVYFHDWPDVTIHTNKDVPDNLDPTKLGRVAYMTAGIAWTLAALPEAEAARLPAIERAATDERVAH